MVAPVAAPADLRSGLKANRAARNHRRLETLDVLYICHASGVARSGHVERLARRVFDAQVVFEVAGRTEARDERAVAGAHGEGAPPSCVTS